MLDEILNLLVGSKFGMIVLVIMGHLINTPCEQNRGQVHFVSLTHVRRGQALVTWNFLKQKGLVYS